MISYKNGGAWSLLRVRGSVFPASVLIALPPAALCAVLRYLMDLGHLGFLADDGGILKETQVWSGFSFLVGFLIVFRTSQAYNRFWDGCTATHQMRAEWFDACSALCAFCAHSTASEETIQRFRNTLVRLVSMLHAAALADLEAVNAGVPKAEDITAYSFSLIDAKGIDEPTLRTLKNSESKVELLFSWIQRLIVENINSGVLSIPPPILSRSFQELGNGMIAFHDAMKISYIPFPFPYAQTCDCLLILHWLMVAFVTAYWVTSPPWGAVFVVIQVLVLWSLNYIAREIENPFGTDANDIDGRYMQEELNRHLLLLLQPETRRTPRLAEDVVLCESIQEEDIDKRSFCEVWKDLDDSSAVMAARADLDESAFIRAKAAGALEPWFSSSMQHWKRTSSRDLSNLRSSQHSATGTASSRRSCSSSHGDPPRRLSNNSADSRGGLETLREEDRMNSQGSSLQNAPASEDVEAVRGQWEAMPDEPALALHGVLRPCVPPGDRADFGLKRLVANPAVLVKQGEKEAPSTQGGFPQGSLPQIVITAPAVEVTPQDGKAASLTM